MSVATVVTRGFGTFGSVNSLPTLGYGAFSSAILGYGRLEYTIPRSQLEWSVRDERLEFTVRDGRLEFTGAVP